MPAKKRFSLGRADRVKSRKLTGILFDKGQHFTLPPFRILYLAVPGKGSLQAGFAAGTRHFKKATDRNRVKRLIRESYRLQKESLAQAAIQKGIMLSVFFIYTDKELPQWEELRGKMLLVLQKLERLIHEIPASNS